MENLNLLFYKTFYSKLGQDQKTFDKDIEDKGKKLTSAKFCKEDYRNAFEGIATDSFMLRTAYPGLLAGTGYAHGVESEKDIKVGFSFDYVTGQPYIPGSSVKGLLRSYFAHPEVIRSFLEDTEVDVRKLENSIFGTNDEDSDDGVDIFFDAVVRCGDKKGFVMGTDAITPHGDDLTKNPVPIKIFKVLPDVVFEFSFKLADSVIDGKHVTAEQKKNLFKNILINFGIGAKTNVGYGVLTEVADESELNAYPNRNAASDKPVTTGKSDIGRREAPSAQVSTLKGNEKPVENCCYNCTVTGVKDFGVFVKIDSTNISGLIHVSKLGIPRDDAPNKHFTKDDKIVARFLRSTDKGINFAFVGRR